MKAFQNKAELLNIVKILNLYTGGTNKANVFQRVEQEIDGGKVWYLLNLGAYHTNKPE